MGVCRYMWTNQKAGASGQLQKYSKVGVGVYIVLVYFRIKFGPTPKCI